MIIGILKDSGAERRVALLPAEVAAVRKTGIDVLTEKGAGEKAFTGDDAYLSAGALVRKI